MKNMIHYNAPNTYNSISTRHRKKGYDFNWELVRVR